MDQVEAEAHVNACEHIVHMSLCCSLSRVQESLCCLGRVRERKLHLKVQTIKVFYAVVLAASKK